MRTLLEEVKTLARLPCVLLEPHPSATAALPGAPCWLTCLTNAGVCARQAKPRGREFGFGERGVSALFGRGSAPKPVLLACHGCRRLEVDLILGTFAHARVPTMDERELDEFEDVLRLDTADVYNWVLGREPIPAVSLLRC